MEELIPIGIQAISTAGIVYVAILQLRAEKLRKKQDTEEEKYKKEKEQQNRDNLSLQIKTGSLLGATGDLAFNTSRAVAGEKTNGDVQKAQTAYLKALAEYHTEEAEMARKYLNKIISREE